MDAAKPLTPEQLCRGCDPAQFRFETTAELDDLTEVIRWWPTAMQLLYLAPMFLLVRHMRASWRAKWTGVWIFVLSGWVGQDYFSPQGFTYLLYLVFVAILLVWFRAPRMLWGTVRPGEAEVEPTGRRQRAGQAACFERGLQPLQVDSKVRDRLVSKIRILLERLLDDPFELQWQRAGREPQRRRLPLQDRDQQVARGRRHEWRAPGDELVEHDACRVQVGGDRRHATFDQFGREGVGRAR